MGPGLTPQFELSYKNFPSYPENLQDRYSYGSTLRAYRQRLDIASSKLLIQNEAVADIRFRDLDESGNAVKKNILSDERLRMCLGDTAQEDALTKQLVSGSHASRRDPHARFIFLWAKHGRAQLKSTRKMLMRLMTYHQIMPRYLEFLFLFGQRSTPQDIRYSGFREQTSLGTPLLGQPIPDLGRSGRHYEVCFNLKTVGTSFPENTPPRNQEWSIRQAAVYHKFDVEYGTTLWVITKGALDLKDAVEDMTGADGRAEDRSFSTPAKSFRSSLSVHTLLAHWATSDWRWYIQWLEETVDQETQDALQGSRTNRAARKEYKPKDLQHVQIWEERANEALTVLESNANVLTALKDYYLSLAENSKFPLKQTSTDDIHTFVGQVKDLIGDCNMQSVRAKLLVQIASQRKTMILQHLQSQATETMESLTLSAQKEAVGMRIITVVTLVYLPATFVSTFFSTDIVKYQPQDGSSSSPDNNGTSYSPIAMNRWLQVTLPLTFVTFLISWIAYSKAKKNIGIRLWAKTAFGDPPLLPTKNG